MALASKIPTQMGMTVSEAMSLRTTMGMLVAGSIIRPRIRTSISMAPLPWFVLVLDGLAHETVRMRRCNFHLEVASGRRSYQLGASEVDRYVLAATSDNLSSRRVEAFDHHLNDLSQVFGIIHSLNLTLPVKHYLKPTHFLSIGDGIDHGQSRCVRSAGVLEAEDAIVLDFSEKFHGLDEVVDGFTGKSNDDVSRNGDGTPRGFDPANALQIPLAGVLAGHCLENSGGARLNGQMDVVAESGDGVNGFYDVAGKVSRMAGGKTHSPDALDFADGCQQFREGALAFRVPVAVHVLAQQLNSCKALICDAPGFGQH